MTAPIEGGEWSAARPGRNLHPGKTRYPFYRRLGGPQGRSGRTENLVPTGIRSRTVQPVVSRYTDWAKLYTVKNTYTKMYRSVFRMYVCTVLLQFIWDFVYQEKWQTRCKFGSTRTGLWCVSVTFENLQIHVAYVCNKHENDYTKAVYHVHPSVYKAAPVLREHTGK